MHAHLTQCLARSRTSIGSSPYDVLMSVPRATSLEGQQLVEAAWVGVVCLPLRDAKRTEFTVMMSRSAIQLSDFTGMYNVYFSDFKVV